MGPAGEWIATGIRFIKLILYRKFLNSFVENRTYIGKADKLQ